jgi:ABC-type Fe3+-hydroxamate transport system substrate-binding protein
LSKRLIAMLAGAVAIAVIAAGCGSSSSDDSSSSSTASLTKQQFIAQADAICKKGNTEINEGFESFAKENNVPQNQEPSKEQGKEIVETVLVPSLQEQSEGIRALGAPSGDEDEVSAMLDSLDESIEKAEDDPEALFDSKSDPFAKTNELASDYGLKVCGEE